MSTESPPAFPDIQWRDDTIGNLTTEILASHNALNQTLVEDARPEDLIIGGKAVHEALHPTRFSWDTSPPSEAKITLEHWVVADGVTVRLAKQRNDAATKARAALLARQVRGSWGWVPEVKDRRTAKIARLVGGASMLLIDVFEFEDEHALNDQSFIDMRPAPRVYAQEAQGSWQRLRVDRTQLKPPDKSAIQVEARSVTHSRRTLAHTAQILSARSAQEASAVQNQGLQEELRQTGQWLIDEKVEQLTTMAANLSEVLTLIQDGRRVRPSRPQHSVS